MTSLNSHSITMLRKYSLKFSGGAVVKYLYANAGTQLLSLGQEKYLENEMATHSSILAWEIPRTESGGYSSWSCSQT